jgi:hypothetical protein
MRSLVRSIDAFLWVELDGPSLCVVHVVMATACTLVPCSTMFASALAFGAL